MKRRKIKRSRLVASLKRALWQTWVTTPEKGAPLHNSSKFWAWARSAAPKFWSGKKSGAALLYLLIHSTPDNESLWGKKANFTSKFSYFYGVIVNFTPKISPPYVDKLKIKSLLSFMPILLSTWTNFWSGVKERIWGHSFFWSGVLERSGKDFLEWSGKRS